VRLDADVGDAGAMADRELLLQVLLNLVLNAAQASPEGGTVVVRARPFGQGAHAQTAIAVEDRGQGLSPEVRRHLFTPFFTTRTGGTGLGLLSSRRLIDDMHGRLGLFPRARGGARALVLLPAAEPAPPRAGSRALVAAGAGR
jgi:signal transduction histidine kinase